MGFSASSAGVAWLDILRFARARLATASAGDKHRFGPTVSRLDRPFLLTAYRVPAHHLPRILDLNYGICTALETGPALSL